MYFVICNYLSLAPPSSCGKTLWELQHSFALELKMEPGLSPYDNQMSAEGHKSPLGQPGLIGL